ncbi:unnamed protein product [Allacma fusca]|uniref:Protein unc-13 homolog 4B n=1 Tax=Allacma fusca TaxID=39272 RepID=A0A8J2Q0A2_9HEXA|nr:unnamed protein product [Allacma fusca]
MRELFNYFRGKAPRKLSRVNPDGEDFFETFSSIKIKYEDRSTKTIREFKYSADVPDGPIADQLWPTLGGWNVDDLYGEVLYALVHALKTKDQLESDSMVAYLQQAFHIDNDKHKKLLDLAREKQAPPLVLNLEVIEAKGLKGKDVNGLSDPFCTLYVSPKQKHNTSMKPATLNPTWREYFSFPVTSHQDEVLSIEVWDYDPEESLSDKMKRFNEVKSTRGLRILMKEIALTASTGKQTHEFLGCLKIPIKNIPADGFDKWFNLESKNGNGNKKKGEIHLRMVMGAEKDKKVAAQEYRHVLHLLLVHELDEENIQTHAWDGQFSKHSEYILNQLRWQGGLLPHDIDMAKWLVYTRVQCEHPLNAKLFPPIFSAVLEHHRKEAISDDEMRKFWFASEKLLDNFSSFVRNIHQCFLSNSTATTQAYHMLKTLGLLKDHISKAPKIKKDLESKITAELITEKTENAISRGAEDLFNSIVKSDPDANETEVETMIKIGQLLIADLRKGLEMLDNVFKELLGIDYFETTYRVYDEKYGELVKPLVMKICQNLKPLEIRHDDGLFYDTDLSIGTSLFELYLAVKQFADLSVNLKSKTDLSIEGCFHTWFHSSVAHWLDIAWCKAMQRIKKAVQLDKLRPVSDIGDDSQITSSAVDTTLIFHQIQIFWNQLSWPEVEGSYAFIFKILDDLCKCVIYYADIMSHRVEEIENKQGEMYQISDELCYAINNIEHVARGMVPISERLEMEKILNQLAEMNGKESASHCRKTLAVVMDNANENVMNKTYEILSKVGLHMEPVIYRMLLEGVEVENEDEGVSKLCKYLDKNLIKLRDKLTQDGFDKVFIIIWENASRALRNLIRTNVEKRRPPSFFQRIHNMLQILFNFFYPDGISEVDSVHNADVREVQDLIRLHGASTADLILKYTQERLRLQGKIKMRNADNGQLTLRATYCEDQKSLRVEILNCRGLKPHDSNGMCDPFVKLQIVPQELYPIVAKKTKVKKKTLFPLFDEIFPIPLSPEQMAMGGILHFSVKDHDLFGRNDFLGEVFLSLESIPFTTSYAKLQDLPQINLPLTMPTEEVSSMLQTLESRQWDQEAAKFAKKERNKQAGTTGNTSS